MIIGKKIKSIALESDQNLITSLLSDGNGHANVYDPHWDILCFANSFPTALFPAIFLKNPWKSSSGVSLSTHITGIQVGSLGSDQHWGVRDRGVFVLHLLILSFVLFLREAAEGKSHHCNFRSICQSAKSLSYKILIYFFRVFYSTRTYNGNMKFKYEGQTDLSLEITTKIRNKTSKEFSRVVAN